MGCVVFGLRRVGGVFGRGIFGVGVGVGYWFGRCGWLELRMGLEILGGFW